MSYEVQIQLLRALQERRIKPVGGLREIPVDVRLICATNEDLEAAIARGSFRADLYHRIDEFVLHMPDLAERREDIMLYADFFLDQANRELDKRVVGFDPEAEKLLVACDWPGNLRQLKNAVTRAVLLTTASTSLRPSCPPNCRRLFRAPIALRDPAGEEERIRRALAAPAATNPRRPGCWGSIARRSTTNCICTASNSRRVWKYSTSFWGFPHRSTAAYKIINFLYL